MTTTFPAPAEEASAGAAIFSVLEVSGMPRRYRPAIEAALVEELDEGSQWWVPGADPLRAHWCIQWRRENDGTKCCRETLRAAPGELEALDRRVRAAAREGGFSARVSDIDEADYADWSALSA